MSHAAIQVESLGKRYRIGRGAGLAKSRGEALGRMLLSPFRALREALTPPGEDETLWALRDVSFEVARGEVVGVIGRNGAGKSTLLRILSRITEPTEGRARIRGRVGSLLEVGTGFHPELTGRENIYLNGATLGMKGAEITRKFDEIVAFAEVERFIDTPVKRYSSGMAVRLAFAVAAHLETEILLVDEVLAVGDAAFQKKCLGKMGDVTREGRTVLFVSHNMGAVSGICRRALWLEGGRVACNAGVDEAIEKYLAAGNAVAESPLAARADRTGNGALRFTSVACLDAEGNRSMALRSGSDARIEMRFAKDPSRAAPEAPVFSFAVCTELGRPVLLCRNDYSGDDLAGAWEGERVVCTIPRLPLMAGSYLLNVYAESNGAAMDWVEGAARIQVEASDFYGTGRLPPAAFHDAVLAEHHWATA